MKSLIVMMILSLVYLVTMDVINKKITSLDFSSISKTETVSEANSYYEVSISGAVANPGKYTVYKGANLGYLVTLAGGFSDNADESTYNLSAILNDGNTYYIGSISNEFSKVSINNATVALLDTLPGIGMVLAKRIVSYRSQEGEFKSLEEITKVTGIGESLFHQIKDLICL